MRDPATLDAPICPRCGHGELVNHAGCGCQAYDCGHELDCCLGWDDCSGAVPPVDPVDEAYERARANGWAD